MVIVEILTAVAVSLVGVVVGARVQKAARFIYPNDVFTIAMAIWILVDSVFGLTSVDPVWYASFALGYLVGYLVVGRTSYIMVMDLSSMDEKRSRMFPWVIWHEDGRTFLQEQSNRALIRRLLMGRRHELLSNVPMSADWIVSAKYPLFPLFTHTTVVVERMFTTFVLEHLFWRFAVRRYTTDVFLAHGSMVSKMELMEDVRRVEGMQEEVGELTAEVKQLRARQGPMLQQTCLNILQKIDATTPANRMDALMREQERHKNDKRKVKDADKESADKVE